MIICSLFLRSAFFLIERVESTFVGTESFVSEVERIIAIAIINISMKI